MPVLVLLFVPVALFNGSAGAGVVLVVTAMAFALAGAPVAALGTIATESKRQTRLKALELKYSEDAPEPPQSVVKDWSAQSSRGFWD